MAATAWEVGFPSIGVADQRLTGSLNGTAFHRSDPKGAQRNRFPAFSEWRVSRS
jgi:hypothetical protein